jgi:hypothetical protein
MAGLLDWLTDGAVSSPIFGGGTPGQPGPGSTMGQVDPMGNPTGGSMPLPTPAPAPTQPMPPAQGPGMDVPPTDPSMTDIAGGMQGGSGAPPINPATTDLSGGMQGAGPGAQPPVPMPQPRPPGAPGMPPAAGALPPNATPTGPAPGPPGPPTSLAPPAPGPSVPAGNMPPGQTALGRALGIAPDQAGKQGQQIMSGISAGLKSVGQNWNKPGLAAFAGSAGAAMEGGEKKADVQQKQATDYLNAAIKAKQTGDEAGYKQNYLRYLAAKLQADTDKAASKDAGANKNDTPTQLYLSAQRLVQNDPEVRDATKQLEQLRKGGAEPAEIAKATAGLQALTQQKQAQHMAALGLNPQTAAQLAKQPGNAAENPVDAAKTGITKDNIGKKLQPGQYFTNPADNKVYQYKGPPKADEGSSKKAIPDKPTSPEPADPMNKSEISAGATAGGKASADDDED